LHTWNIGDDLIWRSVVWLPDSAVVSKEALGGGDGDLCPEAVALGVSDLPKALPRRQKQVRILQVEDRPNTDGEKSRDRDETVFERPQVCGHPIDLSSISCLSVRSGSDHDLLNTFSEVGDVRTHLLREE
jgi:hypothetical protein